MHIYKKVKNNYPETVIYNYTLSIYYYNEAQMTSLHNFL